MSRTLIAATLVALLAGCHGGGDKDQKPKLEGATPEETLTNFRRALWHGDYDGAYGELSSETKARYAKGRWTLFMKGTKVGALLEMVFIDWFLYSVRLSPDRSQAYVVFADPDRETATKEFRMVLEDGTWKLWFSFAELFGMPFEDEVELTRRKAESATEGEEQKGSQ